MLQRGALDSSALLLKLNSARKRHTNGVNPRPTALTFNPTPDLACHNNHWIYILSFPV